MNSHITVRVGRLPGRIAEFTLNGDRTVATALQTAGLDATGFEIRVQGAPATPTTILADGDLVLLVKKIKGNGEFTLVRVGRVPGKSLETVALDEPTVGAALAAAGLKPDKSEVVYLNENLAHLDTTVADDDVIVVKVAPTKVADEPEVESSFEEQLDRLAARATDMREEAEAMMAEANRIESAVERYRSARAELDDLLDNE